MGSRTDGLLSLPLGPMGRPSYGIFGGLWRIWSTSATRGSPVGRIERSVDSM